MLRFSLALVGLCALFTPRAASAYELMDLTWEWQGRPLAQNVYVNLDTFPAYLGTPAEVEAEVIEAIEAFEGVTRLQVHYGGHTDLQATQNDEQIVIVWTELSQPTPVGGSTIAAGVGDSHATECDIRLYNVGYTLDENTWGRQLSHAIAHEIGHCLGLGHSEDPDALMYEYIGADTGVTTLDEDDREGLRALYGDCYGDADLDGVLDCDDCDDTDPSVAPGLAEACDGLDNDCNGVVDELGSDVWSFLSTGPGLTNHTYSATGNVYQVNDAVVLERFEHHAEVPYPEEVSYTVLELFDDADPVLLFNETVWADPWDGWWTSPELNLTLEPGRTYFVAFGGRKRVVHPRGWRIPTPAGTTPPIEVVGFSSMYRFPYYNDLPADPWWYTDYSFEQRLHLAADPDLDGNGVADVCGTCPPDAPDSDGDGLDDCSDPCPSEAGDPDGDGLCAQDDVCPGVYDPAQLDSDGDGLGNACDPTPQGDPLPPSDDDAGGSGCLLGCGGSLQSLWYGQVALFGLVGLRRR